MVRWARRGTWFFIGLAVAVRLLGGAVPEEEAWVIPFAMALCVLAAAWAAGLRRRVTARDERPAAPERPLLRGFALVSVVALLVFWGTSSVAEAMGRALAHDLEEELGTMPRAVVYSEKPLHIGLPGVRTEELGGPDDPLHRYDGLRLLTLAGRPVLPPARAVDGRRQHGPGAARRRLGPPGVQPVIRPAPPGRGPPHPPVRPPGGSG